MMLFDLPQHLRTYIFKLSRKAALRDHLDDHLRSRPRFKRYLDSLGRDYMEVSFRLSTDKTMEIEYSRHDASVSILKEDTVRLLLYEKDEQLVCQLCCLSLDVLKWWQGASFPEVGVPVFASQAHRCKYRSQIPV